MSQKPQKSLKVLIKIKKKTFYVTSDLKAKRVVKQNE